MPNDNRDMYYSSYGYGGYNPNPNMMPNMMPNQVSNYSMKETNDISERLNRLERTVKRLDTRVSRLENPYTNNNDDKNMYMM